MRWCFACFSSKALEDEIVRLTSENRKLETKDLEMQLEILELRDAKSKLEAEKSKLEADNRRLKELAKIINDIRIAEVGAEGERIHAQYARISERNWAKMGLLDAENDRLKAENDRLETENQRLHRSGTVLPPLESPHPFGVNQ